MRNISSLSAKAITTSALILYSQFFIMTRVEFNMMAPNKRSTIVWDWGYLISDRQTETHKLVLFAISDFFVELAFSKTNEQLNSISAIPKENLHADYMLQIESENPFLRAIGFPAKALVSAA